MPDVRRCTVRGSRRVVQWLDEHPGARFILTASTAELCARELEELPHDDSRFISSELPLNAGELGEMVDEMEEWEERDWEFEGSESLLGALVGETEKGSPDDDDEDTDVSELPLQLTHQMQVLPLPQEMFVEGETRTIVVIPQRAFTIQRLIVASTCSALGFIVESIDVDGQVLNLDLPSEVFSEVALGVRTSLEVKQGQAVRIHVRRAPQPREFIGSLIGTVETNIAIERKREGETVNDD